MWAEKADIRAGLVSRRPVYFDARVSRCRAAPVSVISTTVDLELAEVA
jgi:hypothetical protein